jgi:glyoxylase-like metal-dependent hydrolase (beta-lactamase superfamily II)
MAAAFSACRCAFLGPEASTSMKCEIEFLAVGEASKAGDAIAIRYGEPTAYNVMVVDCGMLQSGIDMANHLQKYFVPSVCINDIVLTHPDKDHACGLQELLPRIHTDRLWLIPPWIFAKASLPYFADKTLTPETLEKKIREECDIIDSIISIALSHGA